MTDTMDFSHLMEGEAGTDEQVQFSAPVVQEEPRSENQETQPETKRAEDLAKAAELAQERPEAKKWELIRDARAIRKAAEYREMYEKQQEEIEEYKRALAHTRGEPDRQEELTEAQIRQQERDAASARAQEEESVRAFGEHTGTIASQLSALHGEAGVGQATRDLIEKAGLDFGDAKHRTIIADIASLKNAGEVYYALANDPDAAAELFDAPERRQYAILDRFVRSETWKAGQSTQPAQAPAPPQNSQAPRPARAVQGASRGNSGAKGLDEMSAADFAEMFAGR